MKLLAEDTDYDYWERYDRGVGDCDGNGDDGGIYGIGAGNGAGSGHGDLTSYKATRP